MDHREDVKSLIFHRYSSNGKSNDFYSTTEQLLVPNYEILRQQSDRAADNSFHLLENSVHQVVTDGFQYYLESIEVSDRFDYNLDDPLRTFYWRTIV